MNDDGMNAFPSFKEYFGEPAHYEFAFPEK
jgi:hypothetical protein